MNTEVKTTIHKPLPGSPTKKQMIIRFGNENQVAKALGISRQAVNQWSWVGPIPQRHIDRLHKEMSELFT